MRPVVFLGGFVLVVAGCVSSEVTDTVGGQSASSVTEAGVAPASTVATSASIPATSSPSTSTPPVSSTSTVAATTTTLRAARLGDAEFVGVWPYRTTDEVLAAAVDGIEINELDLIARFMDEVIGWTEFEVTEIYDGTDQMGFDHTGPRGEFHVGTRIVAWSPSGDAVVAVRYASSLDRFEDWGPGVDVSETNGGWSVVVNATPIGELVALPDVAGPLAQVRYGEWESEVVEIGSAGAAITLPAEPTVPGVLSIWYLDAGGVVAGFSIRALPPGPFVAG